MARARRCALLPDAPAAPGARTVPCPVPPAPLSSAPRRVLRAGRETPAARRGVTPTAMRVMRCCEQVTLFGVGRLGICTALCLEKAGYNVLGVDVNQKYVSPAGARAAAWPRCAQRRTGPEWRATPVRSVLARNVGGGSGATSAAAPAGSRAQGRLVWDAAWCATRCRASRGGANRRLAHTHAGWGRARA